MANFWDEIAEEYESWFLTERGRRADLLERRAFLSMVREVRGEYALEVGIGTGHFGCLIARKFKLVGLDLSAKMLKMAEKRCGDELSGLVRGDATRLPFKEGSFDFVYAITVLEFIVDAESALREMFRVTKRGGWVLLGILNWRSSWAKRKKTSSTYRKAHYFDRKELLRRLRAHGRTRWSSAVFFPPTGGFYRLSWPIELIGKLLFRERGALLFFLTVKEHETARV